MKDPGGSRRRPRRWWGVGLVVVLLGAWLVWALWERRQREAPGAVAATEARADAVSETSSAPDPPAEADTPAARWRRVLGGPPSWPADPGAPGSCEAIERRLERACATLDQATYFVGEPPPGGSCAVVRRVAAALARRPPESGSELRSHAQILDNAFHLFRTLDRRTVQWLRTVVREEDASVEPLAYALHAWAVSREACDPDSPLTTDVLSRYAVYLFRTLGGQAYLHRRTPRTEAVTSFYALLIVDRADAAGRNPEGFDPRTELPRTRELIASQELALREDYLAALAELEARWNGRAGR